MLRPPPSTTLFPYTTLFRSEELATKGVKRLAVVTPGFAADCLETLEEIAQENAEIFRHNGGEQFSFIPCLNDSNASMDVIRSEEHTSELQSLRHLVCRLLLE